MQRILAIYFFLLPLSLIAEISCNIVDNGSSEVSIYCTGNTGADPEDVLDKDSCETLKSDVLSLFSQCASALESAKSSLLQARSGLDYTYNHLNSLQSTADSKSTELRAISLSPQQDMYGYITDYVSETHNQYVGLIGAFDSSIADIDSSVSILSADTNRITNFSCSDASCSAGGGGSGNVTCPCQAEWNQLLPMVAESRRVLLNVEPVILTNLPLVVEITHKVDLLTETVSNVVDRLNIPDDRIWSDISDIYVNMQTNLPVISTNILHLAQLFYQIRKKILGDGEEQLQLSTEGVIALNQLAFDMSSFGLSQMGLASFKDSVRYFSNTVSRYYHLFDNLSRYNGGVPTDSQYKFIQMAFTNTTKSARSRFLQLTGLLGSASQTNWFQRMELYQQAQLGWFDTPLEETQVEKDQASLTESGVEEQARLTTNDLSTVVGAGISLSNDLNRIILDTVQSVSSIEITASLPTQITFFPEIPILDGVTFGPIVWETTDFQDTLELIRKCTTLVWRFTYWGVFILVAYSVARLSFILVLYIVHIAKDL